MFAATDRPTDLQRRTGPRRQSPRAYSGVGWPIRSFIHDGEASVPFRLEEKEEPGSHLDGNGMKHRSGWDGMDASQCRYRHHRLLSGAAVPLLQLHFTPIRKGPNRREFHAGPGPGRGLARADASRARSRLLLLASRPVPFRWAPGRKGEFFSGKPRSAGRAGRAESGRLQESAPYLRVRDCWHRASE